MTVTTFDRATVNAIDAEFRNLVREFADKHGLDTKFSGAFNDTEFKPKVTFTIKSGINPVADAKRAEVANAEWNLYARSFGYNKEWLGKSFSLNGKTMTVHGVLPRNHKNPMDLTDANGRHYKCGVDVVARRLGA